MRTISNSLPRTVLVLAVYCLFMCDAVAGSFKFIAFGDMPYSQPSDFPRLERLIDTINADKPAFSIFLGDTKSGESPCTNEHVQRMTEYFNSFKTPLIYSIGDNEWTDCHRAMAGAYNPLERLSYIRENQFSNNQSFGKSKLTLVRQADVMPKFSKYVENALWVKGKFLFVSLHIPGSNNNLGRNQESDEEYLLRNEANLAWIKNAFELSAEKGYAAIVFAFQADIFYSPEFATDSNSGYRDTITQFRVLSEKVSTPILLVHGDSHRLKIDQPLYGSNKKIIETVYRLEVMGADEMQAVEIEVDDHVSSPFRFRPLLIPENILKLN